MLVGTVIGLCPATRSGPLLDYYSQGKMAEIERSQIESEQHGDEESELVTGQRFRLTRKVSIVVVSSCLGAALLFLWLLLV